jgi:hypothetical protein
VSVPDVKIRTTSDYEGHLYGLVHSSGRTPEQTLADLQLDAQHRAEAAAEQFSDDHPDVVSASAYRESPLDWASDGGRAPIRPSGPRATSLVWRWEVVDVRLAPGPVDREPGWVAYGTLVAMTERPV